MCASAYTHDQALLYAWLDEEALGIVHDWQHRTQLVQAHSHTLGHVPCCLFTLACLRWHVSAELMTMAKTNDQSTEMIAVIM